MAFQKNIIKGGNTFSYWAITGIKFDATNNKIRVEFGGFASREAKIANIRDYIVGHSVSYNFSQVQNWNQNPKAIGYELAKTSILDDENNETQFWADASDVLE